MDVRLRAMPAHDLLSREATVVVHEMGALVAEHADGLRLPRVATDADHHDRLA